MRGRLLLSPVLKDALCKPTRGELYQAADRSEQHEYILLRLDRLNIKASEENETSGLQIPRVAWQALLYNGPRYLAFEFHQGNARQADYEHTIKADQPLRRMKDG
jgi:hypothetical protein